MLDIHKIYLSLHKDIKIYLYKGIKIKKNTKTMSFRDFYESLPSSVSPKKDFVEGIAALCDVDQATVRNWIFGRAVPKRESHLQKLAEITGLSIDKLFPKDNGQI